jgi:hypothetical protein
MRSRVEQMIDVRWEKVRQGSVALPVFISLHIMNRKLPVYDFKKR